MASRDLERMRNAVMDGRYVPTEHAYDELEEDDLDVLNLESAILTGEIDQVLTMDPRGTRYVVIGNATDLTTRVGVVARFVPNEKLLIVTVYQIEYR
jgi:hypothetical protein